MIKVVLDTSVLIEKIRTKKGFFDHLVDDLNCQRGEMCVSMVTLTELWAGQSMNFKYSIDFVEDILQPIKTLTIDRDVAKLAGKLIRNKEADGFDAIIAATTMNYGAELATLNKKHFRKVKGLRLYDENL